MKSAQLALLDLGPKKFKFGGEAKRGRKTARPVIPKHLHHVSLRASQAHTEWSFLKEKNKHVIDRLLKRQATKHHVRLEIYVNVGNHLHLKLRPRTREGFSNFLRSITCLISRAVTGAKKGKALPKRFFDHLAWSRVLTSKKEEKVLDNYFCANGLEALYGKFYRNIYLGKIQV